MKAKLRSIMTMMLVFVMVFSICQIPGGKVSAATMPKLNKTKMTLTNKGTTGALSVKNKPLGATYKWSSSNKKVATVNSKGLVSAVKKGTATITCKVTYKDKSYVNLRCNVTVKVPATKVEISNAKLENNAQQMKVGEKFDFNRTITPKGSSDKTYWFISNTDYATVNSAGVVTALQAGTVTLQARCGETKAKALADLNCVTDSIILNITAPVATVTKVEHTSDKVVTVTFSDAIEKSSLINASNGLTANVIIEGKTVNSNAANALGNITPSLSADGLTLTLTTTNKWDGTYNIKIESDIVTTKGMKFAGYNEDHDFSDKLMPALQNSTVDDTGYIMQLIFNKEVNINGLAVAVPVETKIQSLTNFIVTNKANYKLSTDKKTVSIDLSGIDYQDKNKAFTVAVSGIVDLKGNQTEPYRIPVQFYTDTTPKPNAVLQYVERTGRYQLTAHFNRSIQYAGTMSLGGTTFTGKVDSNDAKLVNYTIDESTANNKNSMSGTLGGWYSYNCTSTGSASTTFTVDMSVGTVGPQLVSQVPSTILNNNTLVTTLTLTYNKEVKLAATTGALNAVFRDSSSNVEAKTISYTGTADGKVVTLVLDSNAMLNPGTYTITIRDAFVSDNYGNYNTQTIATVPVTQTVSSKMPAPSIMKTDNPSVFLLYFAKKVDITTATALSNYSIEGVHPISAIVNANGDSGATVEITFAPRTLQYNNAPYQFIIENIKGYNDTSTVMDRAKIMMTLPENIPPTLESTRLSGSVITMTFDEEIKGTPNFRVVQNGNVLPLSAAGPIRISGKTVVINLLNTAYVGNLFVEVQPGCVIQDMNKNTVILSQQIPVTQ